MSGDHFLLESRGQPKGDINDAAQLGDPIVDHPLVQEGRGNRDRAGQRRREQDDQQTEFPPNSDST